MIFLSDFDEEFSDSEGKSRWALNKEITDLLTIRVSDLSIRFKTTYDQNQSLKSSLLHIGGKRKNVKALDALDNVSFDVYKGTVLGVVGHNGAGKSTLLRAIAGILPPTKGEISVRGKVSTLLSLGVGFNSALSGMENIMISGLASGLSRNEVIDIQDEIVKFSEIGEFINLPVRTYSKGMAQRLAFSVAVHMNPEILLIDEALSAGDANFKARAQEKMIELMESAHTLILVSHALGTVSELCNNAIWLDHGRLLKQGNPDEVIAAYIEHSNVHSTSAVLEDM